jgi:hypothetical protein
MKRRPSLTYSCKLFLRYPGDIIGQTAWIERIAAERLRETMIVIVACPACQGEGRDIRTGTVYEPGCGHPHWGGRRPRYLPSL